MIFFPHYALGSGMKNIYSSYEYNEICDFQKNSKFYSLKQKLFILLFRNSLGNKIQYIFKNTFKYL